MSQRIISALRDPMDHESCCLWKLFGAVYALRPCSGKDTSYPPELLRATIGFLLSPQTDEQLDTIVQRLLSCRCVVAEFLIKEETALIDPLQCFDMVLSHLCGFLAEGLKGLPLAKFRKPKPKRTDAKQPWPNCLADIGLGDHTAQQAVSILLRWAEHPPLGHSVLALLGRLSRFWAPYGHEILQNPDVIGIMRRQIICSRDFYVHPAPPSPSWDYFDRIVKSCRLLASDLRQVDAEKSARYNDFEEGLHDLGGIMILMLRERGPSMDLALGWFTDMLTCRRITFLGSVEVERVDPLLFNDDYFQARYQMLLIHRTQRCMNLLCAADTETSSVVTSLCRCCWVVRYCGRPCQVAAWRAEKLPHQDLCTKIHRVRRSVRMLDNDTWTKWLVSSSVAEAAPLFQGNSVKAMTCRAIWLHIMWLKTAKKIVHPVGLNVRAMRAQKIDSINRLFDITDHPEHAL
ncbi:hypothetical protein DFH09DRAFT_1169621 [Mycena vulgaris]|nr:hypothetical protein DFH09DRAFT_1169621 [Mycena vulgaris]